ncbi:MAG: HupE/UreJ family protein [Saprospiraceae bacterium]
MMGKLFDGLMVIFEVAIFQVSRLGMPISSSPDDRIQEEFILWRQRDNGFKSGDLKHRIRKFIGALLRGITPTLSVSSKLYAFFLKEHRSDPICYIVSRLRPFKNRLVIPNLQTGTTLKRFSKKYNFINIALSFLFFLLPFLTFAHEIRPAYLEIKQTTETTYEVLWKIPLLGNKAPKIDPILPDNFTLKQIDDEFLPDAYIRRYEGNYLAELNGQKISIKGLDLTLVDVLVQINLIDESSYTLLLQPDKSEAVIPKEPNKWEVIQLYILLGIEHILIGIDHLLFVLGLLLLVKGIKPLIQTITAFTVAHSITLGAATFDLLSVPQAPVEAVIALSIVFLAREYISVKEGKESMTAKYPWIVAFTFGLLHGFGFAGALSEIGFPQKEVPLALLTFNIGVELGQLIFIGIVSLLWMVLKKINGPQPNWSWKVLPYSMGIIASFWLVERVVAFW